MQVLHFKLLFVVFCFMGLYCAGLQPNPKYNNGRATKYDENTDGKIIELDGDYSTFQRRLIEEVNAFMGVPYRWGGNDHRGMDCSGFVSTVYLNVTGLKLPRKARSMFKYGHRIGEGDLRMGDLVFFERIENDGISHVGIYLRKYEFVHASTSSGVSTSTLDDDYYRSRFVGARRIYNY